MADTTHERPQTVRRWPRWVRGGLSSLGGFVAWAGRFCGPLLNRFRTPERYARGLIIMLPGIESESFFDHSVVWGLDDGGWRGAIEIDDWTTSIMLLFVYHLRAWRRNMKQARRIAARILEYQDQYPGRPVHIIGHSAGGALTVLILDSLPADRTITSAILLAPALSPDYPLQSAIRRTARGVWNFYSPLDVIFLAVGTLLLGTVDGRMDFSAGLIGFREPAGLSESERRAYQSALHQQPYTPAMARTFNLGGHFGRTNRAFVEIWIAPLVM